MAEIEILDRGIAPDPATENTEATLTVDVQVDQAPYIVEFSCCDIFNFDTAPQRQFLDGTGPETAGLTGTHSFTFNVGPRGAVDAQRTATVRVTDSTGAQKTQFVRFRPPEEPAPPVPPAPPEPPEPEEPTQLDDCDKVVEFGLVRARATGSCWQKFKAGTKEHEESGIDIAPRTEYYLTRGSFTLNGIPFPRPPRGRSYVLVEPNRDARGGQLGIDRTITVDLGPFNLLRGPVRWKLPTGRTSGRLAALRLPSGTLGGLPVGGSVEVLFRKSRGQFTTSFPVQVTLPSIIRPFPGAARGSVTGATEISTADGRGVSVDGGRIAIEDAAIGKLALKNFCVSFMSAGVSRSFSACRPPSLNGAPAVSCSPPSRNLERFDGSLLVELPTSRRADFGAYAGIAGGRFAYGGGFVDNAAIPIVNGITLERVGFGLCVSPRLFIRGDGGLAFGRGLVRGDASVSYGETSRRGFFVEASAFMRVVGIPVGNGRVRVESNGTVDFDLAGSMRLAGGFLIINGGVDGFVQPSPFRFNVDGRVRVCIDLGFFGEPCVARADATVSNKGAAGCAGTFFGTFGAFFFWEKPRRGDRFDFGRGCGFAKKVRVSRSRQAGAPFTFPVPTDQRQYVAHIRGATAPPKVRITSPSGAVIESSAGKATTDNRTYALMENPEAPVTSIFLPRQAAPGDWKVEPLPGSTITDIEFQTDEKKPTLVTGKISKRGSGDRERRVADLVYYLRAGDRVALDVVGNGYQQQVASGLRGRRCGKDVTLPDRSRAETRCARVTFTPKFGYAGTRTLRATVTDAEGATMDEITVARYRAATPPLPSRVPALRLVRRGTSVYAIWDRARRGVIRYGAYARLSDGRKLGHNAPETCLAWRIPKVAKTTSVTLQIQAGRTDLRFGGRVQRTLKAGQSYAGPKSLRRKKIPKACASL